MGLKQSRRQWAELFVDTAIEYGVEQCGSDPFMFSTVADGKVELIFAVHVDGIVIAGSNETCRDHHAALGTKFLVKHRGELGWYTGCALKRDLELGALEIT